MTEDNLSRARKLAATAEQALQALETIIRKSYRPAAPALSGHAITKVHGPWFDGYREEPES
jgi:hypothetical protein